MSDIDAGALSLRTRADTSQLQSDLTAGVNKAAASAGSTFSSRLSESLRAAGPKISRAGRTLTRGLTLPLVGLGAVATKFALDYDAAFTKIAATTNTSQKQVAEWRKQVLTLSGETARSPEELANALYFLASAGLDTSQVMDVLESSAKASAAGLGETQDIAKLTANVLNAFPKAGLKAADVIDTLVAAVREGTADPDEFASAMGRILPIASEAGVSFDQLAASLATVSNIGLDVNEGVTAMRGLLQALTAPTAQSTDALKKLGLTNDEVRASLAEDGLLDTLDLLEEKSHGQIDVLQDLIPNVRSLTGFFGLQGQKAAKVDQIFASLADSTGALDKAFETTADSKSFQFAQAMNRLRVAGVRLGNQIIPILVDDVVPAIEDLVHGFEDLTPEQKKWLVQAGIAVALAGPFLRLAGGLTTLAGGLAKVVPWLIKWPKGPFPTPTPLPTTGAPVPVGGAPVPVSSGLLGPDGNPLPLSSSVPTAAPGVGAFAPTSGSLAMKAVDLIAWVAVAKKLGELSADTWSAATGDLENYGEKTTKWFNFWQQSQGQILMSAANPFAGEQGSDVDGFKAGIKEVQAALDAGDITVDDAADRIQNLADEFGVGLPDGAEAAAEALKSTFGLTGKFGDALAGVTNASKKQRHQFATLVDAYEDTIGPLKGLTRQQVLNLVAVGDLDGAIDLLQGAYDKAWKRQDDFSVGTAKERRESNLAAIAAKSHAGQVNAAGHAAKGAESNVRGYGKSLDDIPPSVRTKIEADTGPATADVAAFVAQVRNLPTLVIDVATNLINNIPFLAAGDDDFAGGLAVVGERGPELAVFPKHTRIVPHGEMGRARGSDGGSGRLVILEGQLNPHTGVIRAIAREEIDGESRHSGVLARQSR